MEAGGLTKSEDEQEAVNDRVDHHRDGDRFRHDELQDQPDDVIQFSNLVDNAHESVMQRRLTRR